MFLRVKVEVLIDGNIWRDEMKFFLSVLEVLYNASRTITCLEGTKMFKVFSEILVCCHA